MVVRAISLICFSAMSLNVFAQDAKAVLEKELRSIRLELDSLAARLTEIEDSLAKDLAPIAVVYDEFCVPFGSVGEKDDALNRIKRIGNRTFLGGRGIQASDGWKKKTIDSLNVIDDLELRHSLQTLPPGRLSKIIESDDAYRIILVRQRK